MSNSFLTKLTVPSEVKTGLDCMDKSLDILTDAKQDLDRKDRKRLTSTWDELDESYTTLIPKLRFPKSLHPGVRREAKELAKGASNLMYDAIRSSKIAKRRGLDTVDIPDDPSSAYSPASIAESTTNGLITSPILSPSSTPSLIPSSTSSLDAQDSHGGSLSALSGQIPEGLDIILKLQSKGAAARGGFADVYICEWLDKGEPQKVGLKVLHESAVCEDDEKIRKKLFREARIWQNLCHDNVLPLFGVFNPLGPCPGLVSPWMENGDVAKYLSNLGRPITIPDRLSLLSQAANGLQYLHSDGPPPVVHGDLKAANVLVDVQGNARLADFGLSRLLEDVATDALSTTSTFGGSVHWMAPELFYFNVEPRPRRCLETDIYAFGGLMLELLGGHRPFHTKTDKIEIAMEVSNGTLPPRPNCVEQPERCRGKLCTAICDDHWEYMNSCWSVDPTMRPKIADVRVRLERFMNEHRHA